MMLFCSMTVPSKWTQFETACRTMGLYTSWTKICLQNTEYGPPPHAASVQGNPVNVTTRLIYLGRDVSSCSDDQAHWPRSKHHESADTCMTAVKTESEYHAVAIQCPCCLCIGPRPIVGLRRRNPDLDKVRRTEVGSLPDVMPAT